MSPLLLAERSGVSYDQEQQRFSLALLGAPLWVTYPDFQVALSEGVSLPPFKQALVLYYFLHSDGVLPARRWISFADLPEGRIYATAFQGYTGDRLARAFGNDLQAFRSACEHVGGQPLQLGDIAYRFVALPRLEVAIVYYQGDDEFPPTSRVLFDAHAGHYLPVDGCAVVGSLLTQQILKHTK